MILLGITGPIGHGKSTLAAALREIQPQSLVVESGQIVAELANDWQKNLSIAPQKNDLAAINHWLDTLPGLIETKFGIKTPAEKLRLTDLEVNENPQNYASLFRYLGLVKAQPQLLAHAITKDNKEHYRPLLQWLGGYLVQKVDPGIWYNHLVKLVKESQGTGIILAIIGGLRFETDAQIVRQAGGKIVTITRPSLVEQSLEDPTEVNRHNIIADSLILNDSSLSKLRQVAEQLYKDAVQGQIKDRYQASLSGS